MQQLPLLHLLQQQALQELLHRCDATAACGGAAQKGQEGGLLCSQAFEPRKGRDVAWGEYSAGRRQHRLVRYEGDANALCECGGRVFGGLKDGSLRE